MVGTESTKISFRISSLEDITPDLFQKIMEELVEVAQVEISQNLFPFLMLFLSYLHNKKVMEVLGITLYRLVCYCYIKRGQF